MAHPELLVPLFAIVVTVALTSRSRFKLLSSVAKSARVSDDRSFARLENRITRLEQAIDAIAIETERIGEGQRFLTRLLADRQTPPATTSGT